MNKFKPGDIIVCIYPTYNPSGMPYDVSFNKSYKVIEAAPHQIKLDNGYTYSSSRFKRAPFYDSKLGKILYK